jgi:hypothetical protein
MTIVKSFSLPETEENRRLIAQADRLCEQSGKKLSELLREALSEYVDKHTRLVQSRIDSFKNPLEEQLDKLHAEFVYPNPKHYGTWEECLKHEGLFCPQAITYSLDKGWKIVSRNLPVEQVNDLVAGGSAIS